MRESNFFTRFLRSRALLRGNTLVELMISTAVLGILSSILYGAVGWEQRAALGELHRARALVLLEYHADCLSSGRDPDPKVVDRLEESLPQAAFEIRAEKDTRTLTVTYKDPLRGSASRSLTVFAREVSP